MFQSGWDFILIAFFVLWLMAHVVVGGLIWTFKLSPRTWARHKKWWKEANKGGSGFRHLRYSWEQAKDVDYQVDRVKGWFRMQLFSLMLVAVMAGEVVVFQLVWRWWHG